MRKTALLVIDVQIGLLEGPEAVHDPDGLLARLARLVAAARHERIPVVYVQDVDVGGPGTREYEIHPTISAREGELSIHKTACDSFFDTELHDELQARGIGHVVVVGLKSQFCIDTTARRATSLGYDVTLVADGHSTSDSPVLSAKQVIAHVNSTLDGFGTRTGACEVRPIEMIRLGDR
ncbi:MAG: isochorismatase family protein [Deltaproteobacteria bacterium]|nr:isochorismatase family protein [Deltaproteobacteria bacterium]